MRNQEKIIQVALSSLKGLREGPRVDTFLATTEPSLLDGEIVTKLVQLNAMCAEIPLPPYLPLSHLVGYVQHMAGAESAVAVGGDIN